VRALGVALPGVAARVVERLWCTPPRAPLTDAARAVLASGEPMTLAADGRRVAGWAWGDGPGVLLVHGWGGHAGQLTAFVAPLVAAGYRVLAFDAPGHGRSGPGALGRGRATLLDFRWALALAAARVGRPYAVVAHSIGATAAAWAMAGGPSGGPSGASSAGPGTAPDGAAPPTHAFAPDRAVFLAPAASPADYAARFGRALGVSDAVGRRWQSRLAARLDFRWDELDVCRAPARTRTPPLLVVHDRADRNTAWADGAAVAACWPGATLHTTEGLGHRRLLGDPGVVARVADFLR
jgi:pimeloyl-ACP methyl ester carboxylesterase